VCLWRKCVLSRYDARMTQIDHQRERERLAAAYADKSELELAALAKDQHALTEDALLALQAEFSRRGIPFEKQPPPIVDEDGPGVRLIALRRFSFLPEALVAKGVLDSAGGAMFSNRRKHHQDGLAMVQRPRRRPPVGARGRFAGSSDLTFAGIFERPGA
jgi:hypothetical protein